MTQIPVLTVPEDIHFFDTESIHNISFLTNFSQRDLLSFEAMLNFIKNKDVTIHLTHLANKKTDKWDTIKMEGIKAYFVKQYPDVKIDYTFIDGPDQLKNLDKYIKNANIDMLALTTAKRNIFARMFSPSVSRKMLFYSNTPLLVLRG